MEKKKKDNAKKVSRKGISAEVFGAYNKKSAFVPKRISKNQESTGFLKKLLSQSIMFQSLSTENMKIVIEAI